MFEHYMQGVQPILKMKPVKSMKSVNLMSLDTLIICEDC